jgi:uncharacterized SAM-dependent methyltransferase
LPATPPKWFYDARGSELFEAICELPEYYPTRTETELLARIAPALAAAIPAGSLLIEYGSGASAKTRLLLDAAPQIVAYAPVDISSSALAAAAEDLRRDYPELAIEPLVRDFTRPGPWPALAQHAAPSQDPPSAISIRKTPCVCSPKRVS